jgi:hypothetical protein
MKGSAMSRTQSAAEIARLVEAFGARIDAAVVAWAAAPAPASTTGGTSEGVAAAVAELGALVAELRAVAAGEGAEAAAWMARAEAAVAQGRDDLARQALGRHGAHAEAAAGFAAEADRAEVAWVGGLVARGRRPDRAGSP